MLPLNSLPSSAAMNQGGSQPGLHILRSSDLLEKPLGLTSGNNRDGDVAVILASVFVLLYD